MLKFTKLTLSGFKSFVDPTELAIDPGLTGIVGPNGCGKSNLVEALRWVMGESSSKRMRGGTSMDDVIFAGSADRPSRNIAEVRIDVDNSSGEAPAIFKDAQQLTIGRRIEREKGSGYRVNGKLGRSRDIQLLFADAGSGAQSTSMVGQGRIGAIIAAKPTDRRVVLEEASGISGLYARRHEAELRLRAAETNLTRLDDITERLQSQLRSLGRQVKQAERYRELAQEIRRLEALVSYLDWRAAMESIEVSSEALRKAERMVGERTAAASMAARLSEDAGGAIGDVRTAAASAEAALQRLKLEREQLEAERKRDLAARTEAQNRKRQLEADLDREQTLARDAKTAILRLTDEQATLVAARDGAVAKLQASATAVEQLRADLAERDGLLEQLTRSVADRDAQRKTDERTRQELDQRIKALAGRLNKLGEDEKRITEQLDLFGLPTDAPQSAELEATLDGLRSRQATLGSALDPARAKEAEAAHQLSDSRRQVDSLRAEKSALERLLAGLAPKSANRLPPISNQIRVTPGYERALSAALGDELDAPLLEGLADLEVADRGWLNHDQAAHPIDNPLIDFVEDAGPLSARLNATSVVEDLDAIDLASGQRAVTKAGDLRRWDGYRQTADHQAGQAAAQALEQRNRLDALNGELSRLLPQLEAAEAQDRDAKSARAAVEREIRDVQTELAELDRRLTKLRKEERQRAEQQATLKSQLDRMSSSRGEISSQLSESEGAKRDVDERLEALATGEDDQLRMQLITAREAASTVRQAFTSAEAERQRFEQEQKQRVSRLEAVGLEREGWVSRQSNADSRLTELQTRLTEATEKLNALESAPAQHDDKIARMREMIAEATDRAKAAKDHLAAVEGKQLNLAKEERDAERSLGEAREALVRCETQLEGAKERLAEIVARIREQLAVLPEGLPRLAKLDSTDKQNLPDRASADAQRQKALSQRDSLGAVNLRAEQETEELRSELTRFETERTDVQDAVDKLRGGINELNTEGREKLVAAFKVVSENFTRLFTKLFGGGTAKLELVDSDDPLDAGLQVYASPPGKKLQMLTLLSGGEQALTAMALLFAVFMAKPAPICVLDEVDAPLDDENCLRFIRLVREMAEVTETRFLVVTHNAHTMARVDRLYGVTMAEKGVSSLMSVNLATAEKLADAA